MIARYNFKWTQPPVVECPIKLSYEIKKKIIPVSFNDDKSVKEYQEEEIFVESKSKWNDYLKSFDVGSVSEQVISHIKRGTPLITAHTLPHGDYTPEALTKGAEIVRQMRENGITLDMIQSALKSSESQEEVADSSKEVVENGK